jgi:glycosyltransferase involved in cell wall biosynthesis
MVPKRGEMIRVGFVIEKSQENWMGGINYFQNLIQMIYKLPERKIEAVLFLGKQSNLELFRNFPPIEIIHTELLDRGSLKWFIRSVLKYLFSKDSILEDLLIKHQISLLSHSGYIGKGAKIPVLGWIPDFQHRYLPHHFTVDEIKSRERGFERVCEQSVSVLVSSYTAQNDLRKFLPSCFHKSKVLQFVVDPGFVSDEPDIGKLQNIYGMTGPYFHLPNQFWAHKNHRVIIQALQILKESGREVLVLATGKTEDYRRPEYFVELMTFARSCNVSEQFLVLGIVPYSHLIGLMRNSISLINPSLFEGWSTTVEEAKSLGKRIILSDIPVHREQAPPGGVYFDPHNADSLAEAMWNLWVAYSPVDDKRMSEAALTELPKRKETFAHDYQKIVFEAVIPNNVNTV